MHSRYLDSSKRPYDFLTYFEFPDAGSEWFKTLLLRLRDEAAVPMVYVSHHPGELRRIATTVVRIDAGRVTGIGGTELLEVEEDAL